MEHHNLITQEQSGFRKYRSTQDAVLQLNDDIFRSLNNSEYIGATYIDYKKAFDTISHDKLIAKLPHYGFSPKVTDWFKSYLSARVQKTIANGVHSDWESISFGVPQGSILGPILFILYVNDLSSLHMTCKILQYADDTVLYTSGKSLVEITETLQTDLNMLVSWCDENMLTINAKKTKTMLYTYEKNVKLLP